MQRINNLSPLALAYVGDAVFELYIRTQLVSISNVNVGTLHKMSTSYVNCAAQSNSYNKIKDNLTEDELAAFKRGRNAKSAVPKNADMTEYRNATGLEALIGYIYLLGNKERLDEIMNLIME